MGYNSVLLWAVILVGLLITFLKLNKIIISESLLFCVSKWSEFMSPVIAIEMAFEINPNVVITGDMNSDLFNTQNNKLSEIMTLLNLKKMLSINPQ
jgi:hypothetical protein